MLFPSFQCWESVSQFAMRWGDCRSLWSNPPAPLQSPWSPSLNIQPSLAASCLGLQVPEGLSLRPKCSYLCCHNISGFRHRGKGMAATGDHSLHTSNDSWDICSVPPESTDNCNPESCYHMILEITLSEFPALSRGPPTKFT